MKSLLVDALRQAKAERPEAESEDTVRMGDTPHEGASNDGDEFVEPVADDALELLQTTDNLVVVDVEDEAPDAPDTLAADADAAFEEAFELQAAEPEVGASDPTASVAAAIGRPEGFIEHGSRWLPLLCVLLIGVAMSLVPIVNTMAPANGDLGLTMDGQISSGDTLALETADAPTRFPFLDVEITTPTVAPTVAPVAAVVVPEERPQVHIEVRERQPAGATELRPDTFSTITALYRAYLAGDVTRSGLGDVLRQRMANPQPGAESELKLLLQQYPDEALLHNALGTLLAAQARWPEARVAFERAREAAGMAR